MGGRDIAVSGKKREKKKKFTKIAGGGRNPGITRVPSESSPSEKRWQSLPEKKGKKGLFTGREERRGEFSSKTEKVQKNSCERGGGGRKKKKRALPPYV